MATTSPISNSSNTNPDNGKRPGQHKKLVAIGILLVLLGAGLILYAMYSSNRNDGDGASERRSAPTTNAQKQDPVPDVTAQQRATTERQAKPQPATSVGSETTLKLYANSSTELVNTVQTTVTYPADSLQFVSLSNGTAFPRDFGTDTATPGQIKIVRAVSGQSASVRGEQLVATIKFKVLKNVSPASVVLVDKSASFLVTSKDNTNLLNTSAGSLSLRK